MTITPDTPGDDGYSALGSKDGEGAGDHDEPFVQGCAEKTIRSGPVRIWAKLLGVRSSDDATDRRMMETRKSHEGIER